MKVIGYIRVSTQGQARDGYSLAYQEDEIKTYCQTHGYTLLRLFKDEGISGAKVDEEALEVDRLGFQEMVKSENDEILYYEGGIPTNSAYISEMKKIGRMFQNQLWSSTKSYIMGFIIYQVELWDLYKWNALLILRVMNGEYLKN